jgi:hypothetical protein
MYMTTPGYTAGNTIIDTNDYRVSYMLQSINNQNKHLIIPQSSCGPSVCDGNHCPGEVWTDTFCAGFGAGVQFCRDCHCNFNPPVTSCGSWYPCGVCFGSPF